MPTVLRVEGYRFFFFSNETNEPPHIHVKQAERYAKFWLDPVALARNISFRRSELTHLHRIVEERQEHLLAAWHEHFSD
ncbi:MAG: DUF4160 domain-containing protein [Terriglobales bacterium]|jgi:hypothetical protein